MTDFSARNHYDLLGVAHDATLDEIEAAFRKASLEEHPDRSEYPRDIAYERWHWVLEAYETLCDLDRRVEYDEWLSRLDEQALGERQQREAQEQAEWDRYRREVERQQREQTEREQEQQEAREWAERDRHQQEEQERQQRERTEREREQEDSDGEDLPYDGHDTQSRWKLLGELRRMGRLLAATPSKIERTKPAHAMPAFRALLVGGLKASPFLLLGIGSVLWWEYPPEWALYTILTIIGIPGLLTVLMLFDPESRIMAIGLMFVLGLIGLLLAATIFIPYVGIAFIALGGFVAGRHRGWFLRNLR